MTQRGFALLDADSRRRAAITQLLFQRGVYVEPFEAVGEVVARWPTGGALLVHDADAAVTRLVAAMTETGQWLPIVAYAEGPDTAQVVRAVLDGAIDYLAWPCETDAVMEAVAGAEAAARAAIGLKLREARARSRLRKLTRREREVLAGVADGLSNRLIGERLAISPRTVEIHRASMLAKMGAQHTSEAIRIAVEASLVA
ncbi:MAG: response regulator transcription factor [Novosphingobium sp.]